MNLWILQEVLAMKNTFSALQYKASAIEVLYDSTFFSISLFIAIHNAFIFTQKVYLFYMHLLFTWLFPANCVGSRYIFLISIFADFLLLNSAQHYCLLEIQGFIYMLQIIIKTYRNLRVTCANCWFISPASGSIPSVSVTVLCSEDSENSYKSFSVWRFNLTFHDFFPAVQ